MIKSRGCLILGWSLLLSGFFITILDVNISSDYVGKFALRRLSDLPETVTWEQAREALVESGRRWANHHRFVLWPALLMLAGGVLLGITRKPEPLEESTAQPDDMSPDATVAPSFSVVYGALRPVDFRAGG
jgi:hypothetical protein